MNMDGPGEILIDHAPGLTRAMLMRGEGVVEAWQDFAHAPDLVDSVHRVRVDRLFPAQGRATARLADDTPISIRTGKRDSLATGDIVTVTITAAPRQDKPWQAVIGARLVGRDLVLLPGQEGIAISRHLPASPDNTVMAALTSCLESNADFGVILRRSAGTNDDLPTACRSLVDEWRRLSTTPARTGCVFDGGGLAARLRRQFPDTPLRETNPGTETRFDAAWESMIDMVSRPEVALAGGGRMWIEPTHALTAVDLDSGMASLEALFAAAPAAIASQLRLRQTGGLVMIDLPRMTATTRKRVDAALVAALADDPRHPEWIGRTRAGLVEIRLAHGRAGPATFEDDLVAVSALAVLRAVARRPTLATPVVDLPAEMAAWLKGPGAPAMTSLDRAVTLVVSSESETATLREPAR